MNSILLVTNNLINLDLIIFNNYIKYKTYEIIYSDIRYKLENEFYNKNLLNYIYFNYFLSYSQRIKQLDEELEEYFNCKFID